MHNNTHHLKIASVDYMDASYHSRNLTSSFIYMRVNAISLWHLCFPLMKNKCICHFSAQSPIQRCAFTIVQCNEFHLFQKEFFGCTKICVGFTIRVEPVTGQCLFQGVKDVIRQCPIQTVREMQKQFIFKPLHILYCPCMWPCIMEQQHLFGQLSSSVVNCKFSQS